MKLGAPRAPQKTKTSLHIQAGESANEKYLEYYFTPKSDSIYESPE